MVACELVWVSTHSQKSPTCPQKSSVYLQKSLANSHGWVYLCKRALYIHKRALYIHKRVVRTCMKEITFAKEPCVSAKELYISTKELHTSAKELYTSAKESWELVWMSLYFRNKLLSVYIRSLYIRKKASACSQKSPTCLQKSPTCPYEWVYLPAKEP